MEPANARATEVDSFLYHITHDLKSYMRAIRVIPQWVAEDLAARDLTLPEDVAENLDMLSAYVAGMDRMLDGLTELSRIGRLADAPERHDVPALLQGAWRQCHGNERAVFEVTGNGATLAPENDLMRLLRAVLGNAIGFNDTSDPQVSVVLAEAGDRIVVTVDDNGPGIPAEFRDRVFEPLETLQPKDSCGTVGLGLAVARRVLTSLGGDIAIADVPGQRGTRVLFDLPAA